MSSKSTWRPSGLPILLLPYLVACTALIGCLQPESTGPAAPSPNTKELEDPVLLAGASSSTNWPVKIQRQFPIEVTGKVETSLQLHFHQFSVVTLQTEAVRISGFVTVIPGSAIPALHPVKSVKWSFEDRDTLEIPLHLLDSISGMGQDTVTFTLRLDSDTEQVQLMGFGYSKKRKEFFKSPFSPASSVLFQFFSPRSSYEGWIDTATLLEKIPGYLAAEMSFYIPGTFFHWKIQLKDSLSIGPLPSGVFPLQLITVAPIGVAAEQSQVEIFEVILKRQTLTGPFRFFIGERLLSKRFPGPVPLLPDNP